MIKIMSLLCFRFPGYSHPALFQIPSLDLLAEVVKYTLTIPSSHMALGKNPSKKKEILEETK